MNFENSHIVEKLNFDIVNFVQKCYKYLSGCMFMYDDINVKVCKIINRLNYILVNINSSKIDYDKVIIDYDIICHYCIGDHILSLYDLSTFRKDLDVLKGGDK